jgi:hypothetical protein
VARDKRYPDNWKQISDAIRHGRAKGRCEARWDGHRCPHREGGYYPRSHGRIILYCHHLGIPKPDGSLGSRHDKMDCRPENLLAVCYPCHVKLDADIHKEARRARQEQQTREAWARRGWVQLELEV